jgi:hypothetical protein
MAHECLDWGEGDVLHRVTLYKDPTGTILHGLSVGTIEKDILHPFQRRNYVGARRNVGQHFDPSTWPGLPGSDGLWVEPAYNPRLSFWPEGQKKVERFDIDGPGGERIVEVSVSETTGGTLAFKAGIPSTLLFCIITPRLLTGGVVSQMTTNRNREAQVGSPGSQGWTSYRAPEGKALAGLIVSFMGKSTIKVRPSSPRICVYRVY